jgi:hypothetical protein
VRFLKKKVTRDLKLSVSMVQITSSSLLPCYWNSKKQVARNLFSSENTRSLNCVRSMADYSTIFFSRLAFFFCRQVAVLYFGKFISEWQYLKTPWVLFLLRTVYYSLDAGKLTLTCMCCKFRHPNPALWYVVLIIVIYSKCTVRSIPSLILKSAA